MGFSQRLLIAALLLYMGTGYLAGQTFFDRGANKTDPRYLTIAGIAAAVAYSLTLFWLWGNDSLFKMERGLWLVLPWVLILVGFGCFFLIR